MRTGESWLQYDSFTEINKEIFNLTESGNYK